MDTHLKKYDTVTVSWSCKTGCRLAPNI